MNKKRHNFGNFDRMLKTALLVFGLFVFGFTQGQLKTPLKQGSAYPVVATHSENGKLYTVSIVDPTPLAEEYEICVYDGTFWSCLPHFKFNESVVSMDGAKYSITSVVEYRGEVYIGGKFREGTVATEISNLRKFDGENWISVASNIKTKDKGINQMIVWEDTLIAAGSFAKAGAANVSNIARFDGTEWDYMGANSSTEGADGEIKDLKLIQDFLYVAGDFNIVGGTETGSIARWSANRNEWGGIGEPFQNITHHIEAYNGGLVAVGENTSNKIFTRIFKDGIWITPTFNEPTCASANCIPKPVVIGQQLYLYGPFTDGTSISDLAVYKISPGRWEYTGIALASNIQFQIYKNYNVCFGSFNTFEGGATYNNVMGLKEDKILVSGTVYGDANNNCTLETASEEGLFATVIIRSNDFNREYYAIATNDDGHWSAELNANTSYEVEALFSKDKFSTPCSKKPIAPLASGSRLANFNLAFDFSTADTDLTVKAENLFDKITPSNKEGAVFFYASNNGNRVIDGKTIHIRFDSTLSIKDIIPTPEDRGPGYITWTVNNLKPGQTLTYKLILNPTQKTALTELDFYARAGSGATSLDSDTKDNFDTIRTVVNNQDELNFKTTSHSGVFDSIDELSYGIYFTNTSKSPTQYVTIVDTLDTDLPDEVRWTHESHYSERTLQNNILICVFKKDINLQTNENGTSSASGFFKYKFLMDEVIQKKNNQVFTNTATIHFHYKEFERTNTVTSTISRFNNNPSIENNLGVVLYPVPSKNKVTIANNSKSYLNLKVYNSQGAEMARAQVSSNSNSSIDVSAWSNGIYIITNGSSSVTFVVQH